MPARLVYAPKAYVFTKNSVGEVLNLTDYVTGGSCQRLINQASTASVTLRNPERRFTIGGGSDPHTPTFHPMDAITIYLERLKGYPVQVFTGFLDDTPYYQMYPGTVTLQATCTIKRLMYTYFDPSLPYVNAFLNKFGWLNYQDGTVRQTAAATDTSKAGTGADLSDGSIGKILYAVLRDIGEWDDTNIWIENLPSGLATRVAALMHKISADTQEAANEFITFMSEVVGSGSQGGGGGPAAGGPSSSTNPSAHGSGPRWHVTASLESLGGNGSCRAIQADGYSELSTDPHLSVDQLDFAALGHIPCLTPMVITNPANGKSVTAVKQDVGAGSDFLPVMGIYPGTVAALGLGGGGQFNVIIQRADGGNLSPVRGTPA